LSDERKNDSYFNSQNSTIRDSEIDSASVNKQLTVNSQLTDSNGGFDTPTLVVGVRVPLEVYMVYRRLDARRKRLLRSIVSGAILSLAQQKPESRSEVVNVVVNVNVNEAKAVSGGDPILEKKAKMLEHKVRDLQQLVDYYEKELEKREQDVKELQEKLREAQEKLRDLQQLESLRTQLEQLRRENESLRRWIQEALLRLEKGNVDSAKALLNSLVKSKPLG